MLPRERVMAMIATGDCDRLPLMPITMMFASDLHGSKYRDYVTDHRVLAAAQIETAGRFGFDYVSVISDPAREASDLGAAIEWFEDQPPAILESQALLRDKAKLSGLRLPDPAQGRRMSDRIAGAGLLKERAGRDLIVEGWVEGPCAMAADLRGVNALMTDFLDDPAFVRDLFDFVVEMETVFGRAQIAAGADLVGIGDAAASLVGPRLYDEFVLPYEKKLIENLHAAGAFVRLHICGRTRRIARGMGRTGADIIDLDYPTPLADARRETGPEQVLLGNVDPVRVLQQGTADDVARAFAECHQQAGARYIVGAGCEIPRGTPYENVTAMCEYARSHAPF
ncbi:MAG TPA: uroporphyrinogen decarboxylase family protein [Bryobacteraceae bacterium]|nr:uroporphyrinogen decarboxylase family protein [Bryobacteraceae bacterium]